MGKVKEIFGTLKGILLDKDVVSSTDLSKEEQIDIIRNSDLSEDEKRELTESVTKFDPNYIFRTSELKLKHSLAKQEKIKNIELNSIKDVADVKEKIDSIGEIDR